MLIIAYTKNQSLSDKLSLLDELRKELHILPLNRKKLYAMQWDATRERISYALKSQKIAVTPDQIEKYLADTSFTSPKALLARSYAAAIHTIRTDWYVSDAIISPHTISILDAFVTQNKRGSLSKRTPIEKLMDLKQLLSYIQSGNEHPVIQAGIVYIEIVQKELIPQSAHLTGILLAYTLLYKYGWDYRDLLILEEILNPISADYAYALSTTRSNNNATQWLEFIVDAFIAKTRQLLSPQQIEETPHSYGHLNDRHMHILSLFDSPHAHVTNKHVQTACNISQITASRDLAKLTDMGLILAHAKGRSTYYTRL